MVKNVASYCTSKACQVFFYSFLGFYLKLCQKIFLNIQAIHNSYSYKKFVTEEIVFYNVSQTVNCPVILTHFNWLYWETNDCSLFINKYY